MKMIFLKGTYDLEFVITNEIVFNWVKTGVVTNKEAMVEMFKRKEDFWREKLKKHIESDLEEFLTALESSKLDENDRAFYAPAIFLDNELMEFRELKELLNAVSKHQIVIDEVYEGFIY